MLGVTPAGLLASPDDAAPGPEHPGLREIRNLADRVGELLGDVGDARSAHARVDRALRRVQIEIEELVDGGPAHGAA